MERLTYGRGFWIGSSVNCNAMDEAMLRVHELDVWWHYSAASVMLLRLQAEWSIAKRSCMTVSAGGFAGNPTTACVVSGLIRVHGELVLI